MYTNRELSRLGTHKLLLRRRIAERRAVCVESAARVLRPLAWMDRWVALAGRAAPYLPLLAWLLAWFAKPAAPRRRPVSALLRWGPTIFAAFRGMAAMRHR